ncbi:unnamed protein product, partial [Prorocentrum cordatum]
VFSTSGFFRMDCAPAFTCKNNALWVVQAQRGDVHGRWLSIDERARLCGVVPETLGGTGPFSAVGIAAKIKVLGNMMPVDTVGTVLAQVMQAVAVWEAVAMSPSQAPGDGTEGLPLQQAAVAPAAATASSSGSRISSSAGSDSSIRKRPAAGARISSKRQQIVPP